MQSLMSVKCRVILIRDMCTGCERLSVLHADWSRLWSKLSSECYSSTLLVAHMSNKVCEGGAVDRCTISPASLVGDPTEPSPPVHPLEPRHQSHFKIKNGCHKYLRSIGYG